MDHLVRGTLANLIYTLTTREFTSRELDELTYSALVLNPIHITIISNYYCTPGKSFGTVFNLFYNGLTRHPYLDLTQIINIYKCMLSMFPSMTYDDNHKGSIRFDDNKSSVSFLDIYQRLPREIILDIIDKRLYLDLSDLGTIIAADIDVEDKFLIVSRYYMVNYKKRNLKVLLSMLKEGNLPLYRRMEEVIYQECNPPVVVLDIVDDGRTFKLIQDTYLEAGSKQRGIRYFQQLKDAGYKGIITQSTPFGYGQIAASMGCKLVGLDCHLFLPKTDQITNLTKIALQYQPIVHYVRRGRYTKNSEVAEDMRRFGAKVGDDYKVVSLGLDDSDYIRELGLAIADSTQSHDIDGKNIWVAGGSAVIARALHQAFPNSKLYIVAMGRLIYPDLVEGIDHQIYIAPEAFTRDAIITPPYTSLPNYDAKVWQFVKQYGKHGDYIWNVK